MFGGIFKKIINPKEIKTEIKFLKVDSEDEVGLNQIYQLSSDEPNCLRIKQEYPQETKNKYPLEEFWNLPVAGVSYRISEVGSFVAGDRQKIKIIEEPSSKFLHALAVYGNWVDCKGKNQSALLGYVPDEDARNIYKIRKKRRSTFIAVKLIKLFIPIGNLSPGIRFSLAIFTDSIKLYSVEGYGRESGRKRKKHYWADSPEDAIKKANMDKMVVDIASVKIAKKQ